MKKLYIFILLTITALFSNNFANATTVIIQAIGTSTSVQSFSPQIANAICGDTIRWVNVSGTHTTASTTIPSGAATWNSPNITASGYIYVVTVPGTYNYTCHPASGGHMDAQIVVTGSCSSAGIDSFESEKIASVYPNPSNGKIIIELQNNVGATLEVFNLLGDKVFESQITSGITESNLNLESGIYFYELKNKNSIIKNEKLVICK